jgi:hypothetical protein
MLFITILLSESIFLRQTSDSKNIIFILQTKHPFIPESEKLDNFINILMNFMLDKL